MIPSIETIVEDLLAGSITKQQAIAWLNQHAEDAGYCLRDELAGRAMQGLLTAETQDYNHGPDEKLIAHAYKLADLMLKERTK